MSWEHKIAQQIKSRDNPGLPSYLEGTVVSASPLVISAYDGEVMLRENQLHRVDPWIRCKAWEHCPYGDKGSKECNGCLFGDCLELRPLSVGQRVALLGRQTYFILGVIV